MKKAKVGKAGTLREGEEKTHRGHDEDRPDAVGRIRKGVG